MQSARLNLALLYEERTLRAAVQSSTAFSNCPSLDRQAARLHSSTELYGSCSSPSPYARHASENLDVLNNSLPFDRAAVIARARLITTLVSRLFESSRAALCAASSASSNLQSAPIQDEFHANSFKPFPFRSSI